MKLMKFLSDKTPYFFLFIHRNNVTFVIFNLNFFIYVAYVTNNILYDIVHSLF